LPNSATNGFDIAVDIAVNGNRESIRAGIAELVRKDNHIYRCIPSVGQVEKTKFRIDQAFPGDEGLVHYFIVGICESHTGFIHFSKPHSSVWVLDHVVDAGKSLLATFGDQGGVVSGSHCGEASVGAVWALHGLGALRVAKGVDALVTDDGAALAVVTKHETWWAFAVVSAVGVDASVLASAVVVQTFVDFCAVVAVSREEVSSVA